MNFKEKATLFTKLTIATIVLIIGTILLYNAIIDSAQTDGPQTIKVKDTPEARNYFENQNNIIRQKNIDAGFESEIGTWKLESEDEQFISFGPKQYLQKPQKWRV